MINEKNNFLTVSWLSGLLSAEIFISTGEWGVQMPPLTSENSYFLRSGPQGATLVMVPNEPSGNVPRTLVSHIWDLVRFSFSFGSFPANLLGTFPERSSVTVKIIKII